MYESYNVFLGIPRPAGKGQRCIIMGMGSKDGWIKGTVRVWKHRRDGPQTEDYHADIDGDAYEKWIRECLPLLPPNSVLIFDNAPYHSKKIENCTPRSTWKKKELKEWLEKKNIGNVQLQLFITFSVVRVKSFLKHILFLTYDNSALIYDSST